MDNKVSLKKEIRVELIQNLKDYFLDEREEEIGSIAVERLLDFLLQTLGSAVYNQAIDDSKKHFQERLDQTLYDADLLYK